MNLEATLRELQSHITCKSDTNPGDVILVGTPGGIFYGHVQEIGKNVKKGWYDLSFTLLVLPPVHLCWTLRIPQMCGELFTIDNEQHFVIAIDTSRPTPAGGGDETGRDTVPRLSLVKNDET